MFDVRASKILAKNQIPLIIGVDSFVEMPDFRTHHPGCEHSAANWRWSRSRTPVLLREQQVLLAGRYTEPSIAL